MLVVGELIAVHASFGLSTSAEFRSPVAVGVPGVPLAAPPASVTEPLSAPARRAAALVPVIVMVIPWGVPSTVATVNVSAKVWPTLSACTVALLLFNV